MTRALLGTLVGLLFGLFLGIDLVLLGVLSLNSIAVFVLGIVGLVLGGGLGYRATHRHAPPEKG